MLRDSMILIERGVCPNGREFCFYYVTISYWMHTHWLCSCATSSTEKQNSVQRFNIRVVLKKHILKNNVEAHKWMWRYERKSLAHTKYLHAVFCCNVVKGPFNVLIRLE